MGLNHYRISRGAWERFALSHGEERLPRELVFQMKLQQDYLDFFEDCGKITRAAFEGTEVDPGLVEAFMPVGGLEALMLAIAETNLVGRVVPIISKRDIDEGFGERFAEKDKLEVVMRGYAEIFPMKEALKKHLGDMIPDEYYASPSLYEGPSPPFYYGLAFLGGASIIDYAMRGKS